MMSRQSEYELKTTKGGSMSSFNASENLEIRTEKSNPAKSGGRPRPFLSAIEFKKT